jgi:hypothetical protein
MTDFLTDTIDLTEFAALPIEAIVLTADQIAQALQRSRTQPTADRWQAYLDAMADLGFEQWLNLRLPGTPIRRLDQGLWLVNGFRVRSIATPADDEILVQQSLTQPESAAHLYVGVVVQEETAQVEIAGSIRFDQLTQQTWPIEAGASVIAIDNLDLGSNQLLLTLRCADPATIPLPATASVSDRIGQSVMNVAQWLNRQLDTVAEELSWVLMPPMAAQPAMRSRSLSISPEQTLQQILQTIAEQGVILPQNTQTAYQDLTLGEPALRVYVSIGSLENGEWSLLAIVGTQSGEALPADVKLSLSEGEQTLFEQGVELPRSQSYLYAQVIGSIEEQFQVTITLPDGLSHTLPEFVFQPGDRLN